MPNRIVREGILDSEPINTLSWCGEVFYRRLMSIVDDYGRFDGRVAILRTRLYSLKLDQVSESDVRKWLDENSAAGVVRLYEVGGKPYVVIVKFGQLVRTNSKWPAPPDYQQEAPPKRHVRARCKQIARSVHRICAGAAPNGADACAQPPVGAAAGDAQPHERRGGNPKPIADLVEDGLEPIDHEDRLKFQRIIKAARGIA